jgi:tRNA(Arg) A34 adenosine deaminase TadA
MTKKPDAEILSRLIDVIAHDIVPLTRVGVGLGNKVFGAAILHKADLSLVIAGTNNERENPLWHGEVHTLKQFYEIPAGRRPATSDCIFLATHEPCSLCLSAITWTGFDNFYYLFGYTDTANKFGIPHDLKILRDVFGVEQGRYLRENSYWCSHSLNAMIATLPENQRTRYELQVTALTESYASMSSTYQSSKEAGGIPLR